MHGLLDRFGKTYPAWGTHLPRLSFVFRSHLRGQGKGRPDDDMYELAWYALTCPTCLLYLLFIPLPVVCEVMMEVTWPAIWTKCDFVTHCQTPDGGNVC
jgi:hypothetical protein